MRKNIIPLIILCFPALLSISCHREVEVDLSGTGREVAFTCNVTTRAAGGSWEAGDPVGLFMVGNGMVLGRNAIIEGADNRKYVATAGKSATLSPAGNAQTIYYPQNGSVDFYAYHPFIESVKLNDYVYPVDVSDQSDFSKIDLLWTKAVDKNKTSQAVPLQFGHALSKMVLNVSAGEGMDGADLSGLEVLVNGMPVKAGFSLADGSFKDRGPTSSFTMSGITPGELYEAIVVPHDANTERSAAFSLGGDVFTWNIDNDVDFLPGKQYIWNLTIDKSGITVTQGLIMDWITLDGSHMGELIKVGVRELTVNKGAGDDGIYWKAGDEILLFQTTASGQFTGTSRRLLLNSGAGSKAGVFRILAGEPDIPGGDHVVVYSGGGATLTPPAVNGTIGFETPRNISQNAGEPYADIDNCLYSAVLNVAEDANTVEPLTLDLAMSVLEIQLGKSTASSIDPNSNISSLEIVAGGPFLGTQMTIGGDGTVTPVNGSFTKQVQVGFGSAPRIGDNPVVRLYAVWDKEIVRPGNIQTVMTTTQNIPYKSFAKVNSPIVEGEVTALRFEFSSALSDNLLPNGDFEEELDGWWFDSDARYFTHSESEGYGGGRCLKISSTTQVNVSYQYTLKGLNPGRVYKLSGKMKTDAVNYACLYGWGYPSSPVLEGTNDWTDFSFEFTAASNGEMGLCLRLGSYWYASSSGTVYFDDLVIKEVEGYTYAERNNTILIIKENHHNLTEAQIMGWLSCLDKAYDGLSALHSGRKPYNGDKQIIFGEESFNGYWGVAGQPIRIFAPWLGDAMKSFRDYGDWNTGVVHEMGHNFGPGHLGASNGAWDFDDELFTNFRRSYLVDECGAVFRFDGTGTQTNMEFFKSNYDNTIAKGQNANLDAIHYTLLRITERYGWDVVIRTFDKLNNLPGNHDVGNTSYEKLIFILNTMSEFAGEDVVVSTYTSAELNLIRAGLGG